MKKFLLRVYRGPCWFSESPSMALPVLGQADRGAIGKIQRLKSYLQIKPFFVLGLPLCFAVFFLHIDIKFRKLCLHRPPTELQLYSKAFPEMNKQSPPLAHFRGTEMYSHGGCTCALGFGCQGSAWNTASIAAAMRGPGLFVGNPNHYFNDPPRAGGGWPA